MIEYRTFRNFDPPRLVRLWNEAVTSRGSVPLRNPTYLEYLVLAKPFFDPPGLIVAQEGDELTGAALTGFAPNANETALDTSTGVVCMVAVRPDRRNHGVGAQLMARAEAYLRGRGAKQILAGPHAPANPFTWGIYGGCQSAGFLESDAGSRPFLERCGYRVAQTTLILQRHLDRPFNVIDGRFPALRRRFEVRALPRRGAASWYVEGVRGPLDVQKFLLEERGTNKEVGHALVWEMDTFSDRWNEHAVGILETSVDEPFRRQGLARFLLAQVLRFYHDQYFTLVEAQVDEGNAPANGLFRGLGFHQIDTGRVYQKQE